MIHKYDYIIAGAGLAGLMLAYELSRSSHLTNKKILVADRKIKKDNDRTWSYWSKRPIEFDHIVYRKWDQMNYMSDGMNGSFDIKPYSYNTIRSIDFYNYVYSKIKNHSSFTFLEGEISEVSPEGNIFVAGEKYHADIIFNSLHPAPNSFKVSDKFYYMLQHFKGQFISTTEDCFDTSSMTFMDFRIDQKGDTRFVYVLPFSPREALVEYTVFSEKLLDKQEYDDELKLYIENFLSIKKYKVDHEEFGIVPMTNFPYKPKIQGKVINIGTLGGFVKPTSGYSFLRTNDITKAIVKDLETLGTIKASRLKSSLKYHYYDSILLNVIFKDRTATKALFTKMFEELPPQLILKFLDEETTVAEDLEVIKLYVTNINFFKASLVELVKLKNV